MGVSEGEKREKVEKICEEIIAEHFLNSMKNSNISRRPNELLVHKWKEVHNRYITVKLLKVKDKEKILKTRREKQFIMNKGNPIQVTSRFLNRDFAKGLQTAFGLKTAVLTLAKIACLPACPADFRLASLF